MSTPNLGIIHIAAAQNQKEVTANTALDDLDLALTNVVTENLTGVNFTLPQADAVTNMVFHFTGSISATGIVTMPSSKKLYIVSNQTNQPLLFETALAGRTALVGDSGVGSLPTVDYVILYCDGVNVDVVVSGLVTSWGGEVLKTVTYTGSIRDNGILITFNSASALTYFLPPSPPSSTWCVFLKNIGTGVVTVNRGQSTIDQKSSNFTLTQGDGETVTTDGFNYFTADARPQSIGIFASGVGSNAAVLLYLKMDRPCIFPANAPNSLAIANTAATGSTTYTFKKNGSSFATVVFSASGTVGAWTQASDATFGIGDILELDTPVTADATLANVGFTLQGYRF